MATANHVKGYEEAKQEAPIHGDILESIVTRLPLIYLASISHVSKAWNRAVVNSLRVNRIKPWLMLHFQRMRPPHSITTYAYDPRSHMWVQVVKPMPPIPCVSPLRSAHSTLLYVLSPPKLSFSFDPFHTVWHTVDGPVVWRNDPVVALVGHHVVVAGGAYDFSDDPLTVEMYDMWTGAWDSTCPSMPEAFVNANSTTWLSVAVNSNKMYVTAKTTGITYIFCPDTKAWHGPYRSSSDERICNFASGFAGERFTLVGVIGGRRGAVEAVKLWELKMNCESLESYREMGEMPKQLVKELKDKEGFYSNSSSVEVYMSGDIVYVKNASNPGKVFLCEIGHGGVCNWKSIPIVMADDDAVLSTRMSFTCSNIEMRDLLNAPVVDNNTQVSGK